MIKILGRAARRLDDHWVGDLLGALCLFSMLGSGLLLGYGLGLE